MIIQKIQKDSNSLIIKYKLKETNEYINKIKESLVKFGKKNERVRKKIKKIKK